MTDRQNETASQAHFRAQAATEHFVRSMDQLWQIALLAGADPSSMSQFTRKVTAELDHRALIKQHT